MKKRGHIHGEGESDEEFIHEDEDLILSEKLSKLKKELLICSNERREYLEGWQRAKADLVNAKKMLEQELKEKTVYAEEAVLLNLLPMIDSFEMAFADKETWQSVNNNWRMGIEHIHNQFMAVLREHGMLPINPRGEKFDPLRHESVGSVRTKKKTKDGLVMHVLQKGYQLHNRVVRPAKVEVAVYTPED